MTLLDDPIAPSSDESDLARESSRRLSRYRRGHRNLTVQISQKGRAPEAIELPAVAVDLLMRILRHFRCRPVRPSRC